MIRKVIEGHQISLPSRFGYFAVTGAKPKIEVIEGGFYRLAPNWRRTKELWDRDPEARDARQIVYCTNEHTDGVRYKYTWSKRNSIMPFKEVYSLKMMRGNKRKLHREILSGHEYVNRYSVDWDRRDEFIDDSLCYE